MTAALCRLRIALRLEACEERVCLPLDAHRHADVEVQEAARLAPSVRRLDQCARPDESVLTTSTISRATCRSPWEIARAARRSSHRLLPPQLVFFSSDGGGW